MTNPEPDIPLVTACKAQRAALDELERLLPVAPVLALMGQRGSGKSSVARLLVQRHGGVVLDLCSVYEATVDADPTRWEDAVKALLEASLAQAPLVAIDDFHHLPLMSNASSLRGGFFTLVLRWATRLAQAYSRTLLLTGPAPEPWQMAHDLYGLEALAVRIADFDAQDYREIASAMVGSERVQDVDFDRVFRHAAGLSAHTINMTLSLLHALPQLDTDAVIDVLDREVLQSNTKLAEVEALPRQALPGTEEVFEQLQTHVTAAFEQPELAARLGFRPKRGVLLYGPPGTGKTSIGRHLAHRIGGKFFMIDGSYVTEPPTAFFMRVEATVKEAKANAPSVLFIDDADLLFDVEHIAGFARYLLTLLDGLESGRASQVCIMMTAMDPQRVPAALLRSGRVELWLEIRPPDRAVRASMLEQWVSPHLPGVCAADLDRLAGLTEGCVAADLRRLTADALALYAEDLSLDRATAPAVEYLVRANNDIVAARSRMAELLGNPAVAVGRALQLTELRSDA